MKKEARMAMANAGFLAGASFSNSMVGVIHAIAHVIRLQKKLHRMTGLPITLKEAGAIRPCFRRWQKLH